MFPWSSEMSDSLRRSIVDPLRRMRSAAKIKVPNISSAEIRLVESPWTKAQGHSSGLISWINNSSRARGPSTCFSDARAT